MVIKADLKMVENTGAAEKVKANSKTFGKTNRGSNLPFTDLNRKVMEIYGNKTAVADDNHLGPPLLPVNPNTACVVHAQDGKCCSGINKHPCPVVKNGDGDHGH